MKKRYAAIFAAAIMVLGSCGKVTKPDDSEASIKASANAQTSTDTNVTDEEETTTEQDVETTAELDDCDFDSYYNYIIGDGAFGFEMYNNGHIRQSWDNRIEGAKYILKGMATPGTEEKALDLAVSVEQLNSLETDGFMANMKFENTKSFRVGSEKIDGNGITLIGYENSFIFCISYFDENDEYRETCYYEFPIDLIPDLVDAVQYADGYDVTESVDDPGVEITGGTTGNVLLSEGIVWNEENKIGFMGMYQGKYITENFDMPKAIEIVFDALADEKVTSTKTTESTDDPDLNLETCLELQIIFFDIHTGRDPEYKTINVGREPMNCKSIFICGEGSDYRLTFYEMTDDKGNERSWKMNLPKEYAERLINEVFGS